MNELQIKQLNFLNETVSFYNLKNRCVNDGVCHYSPTKLSPGCAIGRHISDKMLCDKFDSSTMGKSVHNGYIFEQLPENLKELNKNFLEDLQILHDNEHFWTDTGLSIQGQVKVKSIKNNYQLID